MYWRVVFFFQAEDGIRDKLVTGVQTCALPICAFGLSIPQTLEEVCNPQRIALLVYDMQVGILSQIKNADQVTRQVLTVLTAARDAGVRVFFSRHLSLPKELMG